MPVLRVNSGTAKQKDRPKAVPALSNRPITVPWMQTDF
jgi:hypothetical protein